ncbi:WbqC family protein [Hoeflea sp. EC-HK425]|uniref:WbqC family protein n=1 Tax=Hoeflea sp. EC-HK425 TaxID=2038388 RepID=UPI001258970F|nr:WbqC family protein [Hoeflea sp. EC-HK425]VVT29657.1 conserved hypothetical protein [Hoeflea sp. EC-HK425]
MTRKAAILQSAYIPWRGYLDMIASVDEFILYDDVQFSPGDWRNRNVIRTSGGPKWLTIPVPKKNRIHSLICDVVASDPCWGADHWNRLSESYRKAPYFAEVADLLEPLYMSGQTSLSLINRSFLSAINRYLGIETKMTWCWDHNSSPGKTTRLVDLCRSVDCDVYITGPAAKHYLDESEFEKAGIRIEWFGYENLVEYPQLHGGFLNAVSSVDLLFNCGPDSRNFLPALNKSK